MKEAPEGKATMLTTPARHITTDDNERQPPERRLRPERAIADINAARARILEVYEDLKRTAGTVFKEYPTWDERGNFELPFIRLAMELEWLLGAIEVATRDRYAGVI